MTFDNTVSQRVEFDCAYLVKSVTQSTYELQGCRYLVEATVRNSIQRDSIFVIEFKQLKSYLASCVPDHAFLYYHNDYSADQIASKLRGLGVKVKAYSTPVTAETICQNIALSLQSLLDNYTPGVIVVEVKLRENTDSFATYKPAT